MRMCSALSALCPVFFLFLSVAWLSVRCAALLRPDDGAEGKNLRETRSSNQKKKRSSKGPAETKASTTKEMHGGMSVEC
jgi:hypothetical protein